ncbi:hypothetical protein ILUMI_15475 [Ignelater luminosus]|uniref:Uncharacterized protein n=1 Tax=Ignelater luminosus TaxID=2038154 RepID=A0A8K0G9W4_IGNLU|nr:hypothetical protein ILUMI_15475 [Ignelater luminosus]
MVIVINKKEHKWNELITKEALAKNITQAWLRKKKNQGNTLPRNNHLLIFSVVEKNKRARTGGGVVIDKNCIKHIKKWKNIDERLIIVDSKDGKSNR